jgi:hypothetical protein
MSISTTPLRAPPPKKRGRGCLGCGCLFLAVLAILVGGLLFGAGYWFYSATIAITTATPPSLPSFPGSDDLYQTTLRKLADFDHDVKNHQPATVRLSADEINVLIARNPDVIANHIQAFVSLSDNQGRVQSNIPTELLSYGWIKGRYFSFDASFEVYFDLPAKSANFTYQALKIGKSSILGPNSDAGVTAADAASKQKVMLTFTPLINQYINSGIRQYPDGADLLDQAKSIDIQNGELVIVTQ